MLKKSRKLHTLNFYMFENAFMKHGDVEKINALISI